MVGQRPNHPRRATDGNESPRERAFAKARELQHRLFMAAKRISELNPVLRGWGHSFRAGNASAKFQGVDRHVHRRLLRLLVQRGGQRLWKPGGRPFRPGQWPHNCFVNDHGLPQLLGTIRYPGVRTPHEKTLVKPYAGNPHVRFERGSQETEQARNRA